VLIVLNISPLHLLRPFSSKHHLYGLGQDLEVESQGPVVDVFAVQADDFFEVGDVGAAACLPHAGDAGFHGQAAFVVVAVLLEFGRCRGSCADQGHVSLQDVEELGEFVQRGFADEFSYFCDAGVVLHLEHEAVHLVLLHQLGFAGFCVLVHGAELVHLELAAVLADAFLTEEDGAGRVEFDGQTDRDVQDQGDQAAKQASQDVHKTLGPKGGHAHFMRGQCDQRYGCFLCYCRRGGPAGRSSAFFCQEDEVFVDAGHILVRPDLDGLGQALHAGHTGVDRDAHLRVDEDQLLQPQRVAVVREDEDLVQGAFLGPLGQTAGPGYDRDVVYVFKVSAGRQAAAFYGDLVVVDSIYFLVRQGDGHDAAGPVSLDHAGRFFREGPAGHDADQGGGGASVKPAGDKSLHDIEKYEKDDKVQNQGKGDIVAGLGDIALQHEQQDGPYPSEKEGPPQGIQHIVAGRIMSEAVAAAGKSQRDGKTFGEQDGGREVRPQAAFHEVLRQLADQVYSRHCQQACQKRRCKIDAYGDDQFQFFLLHTSLSFFPLLPGPAGL